MIHKLTLQIPFTMPPRLVFNVVAPEMLSNPQRELLPSAFHLGAVLEACPSKKQTREEILDYGSVEPWWHAKHYLTWSMQLGSNVVFFPFGLFVGTHHGTEMEARAQLEGVSSLLSCVSWMWNLCHQASLLAPSHCWVQCGAPTLQMTVWVQDRLDSDLANTWIVCG